MRLGLGLSLGGVGRATGAGVPTNAVVNRDGSVILNRDGSTVVAPTEARTA
jgi:hypothetical protein